MVYEIVDNLIDTEIQCAQTNEAYYKIFEAIGTAIDGGLALTDITDTNTYGLMREYMPEFDAIRSKMYEIVDNVMTCLALWERCSDDEKEERMNVGRTILAFEDEFKEWLEKFNRLCSAIHEPFATVQNKLIEKNVLQSKLI